MVVAVVGSLVLVLVVAKNKNGIAIRGISLCEHDDFNVYLMDDKRRHVR